MTAGDGSTWQVVSGTSRGSHHVRSDEPNQDALGSALDPNQAGILVISAADGHGSKQCYRSEIGARLAVEAATRLGAVFWVQHAGSSKETVLKGAAGDLIPAIIAEWTSRVSEHRSQVPNTADEGFYLDSPWEPASLLPYGTTLLVALLGRESCLVLQLGDGDVFAVDASGAVGHPLPPNPALVAGVTNSLCCPDCSTLFKIGFIDLVETPLALLVLATDGYGNSFADAEWQPGVGADVLAHVNGHGLEWVQARLGSWLSESAEVGGDDVSLIMAVRVAEHD